MTTKQILTAYDTLACRGFVLTKLEDGLKKADIDNSIVPLKSIKDSDGETSELAEDSPIFFVMPTRFGALVPAFVHPILFKSSAYGRDIIVADMRPYLRTDERTWQNVIKNVIEFKAMGLYGSLTNMWLTEEGRRKVRDISGAQITVFSSWVSESVARRFALNPKEQMDLAILAGIYYYGLFSYNDAYSKLTERETNNLVSAVSKAVRVKPQDVFDMIENHELELPIKGIVEFCKLTHKVTGSVRLEEFAESAGALFTIVGMTWFGAHARELTSVALEYPPAFISIIATAMSERTYKNSPIAKITERMKDPDKKLFFGSLDHALASYGQ